MASARDGSNTNATGRSRGRPRNPEKDDAIRDAAWAILAQAGYEGLSFEAVAERAGCTRATLYRRFSSKIELIASIMYHTARTVEPVIAPDTSPRDALAAHIGAFIEYMTGQRGLAMLSITEAAQRYPDLRCITEQRKQHEREYYFEIFLRIRPECPSAHMEFVFDTLVGIIMHHTCSDPRHLSQDQRSGIMDAMIALLTGQERSDRTAA